MAAAASTVDLHKQLMRDARALALAMFSLRFVGDVGTVWCDFCLMPQGPDEYSRHAPACKVGAVMARLAELEDAATEGRGQVIAWPAGDKAKMDYGEPWHVDPTEAAHVHDRDCNDVYAAEASGILERDETLFARRVAACVNLCAGMKTAALIHAFDVMVATTARWGLVAVPLDIDEERQAELAAAIDRAIGGA
jgi:hypothetical protein